MRDPSHSDFIERWVTFMKNNPHKWRKIHTRFINSQIEMNHTFLKRLVKQKNGKEKIIKLYNIKNPQAYEELFS